MVKRRANKYIEETIKRMPTKKYRQTKMDRRHEEEGMKHAMKRESEIMGKEHRKVRKKYRQTREDRMHESEGMKKHNNDHHRSHYR